MKPSAKYKLVILDRDGVINEDSDEYIKSPDEWHAIPGSLDAIADLNHAGIKVTVVSNQSGVARGYFTESILQQIHTKMHNELAKHGAHLDALVYCPHHPQDNCSCRKPKLGMVNKILQQFPYDNKEIVVIGDTINDIEMAHNLGCDSILVRTGKGERTIKNYSDKLKHSTIFADLAEAIAQILSTQANCKK